MIATFNPAYWGSWTKFNGYDLAGDAKHDDIEVQRG